MNYPTYLTLHLLFIHYLLRKEQKKTENEDKVKMDKTKPDSKSTSTGDLANSSGLHTPKSLQEAKDS